MYINMYMSINDRKNRLFTKFEVKTNKLNLKQKKIKITLLEYFAFAELNYSISFNIKDQIQRIVQCFCQI